MSGLWSTIFGTPKAVSDAGEIAKTVTGGIVSGIDKAFYTEEEKAENSLTRFQLIADLIKSLQDQFTPRAISRRIIAFMFCSVFLLAFLTCLIFLFLGKLDMIKAIVDLVNAFLLGEIVLTIIFFYFGYYGVTAIVNRLKK